MHSKHPPNSPERNNAKGSKLANCRPSARPSIRMGVLTSIGETLDAFFGPLCREWTRLGIQVHPAAGSQASTFDSSLIRGLSQKPSPKNILAPSALRSWSRDLDVILTSTATASFLARASVADCPIVYFCHGLHWDRPDAWSTIPRILETLLIHRTSGVITLNADDERWFRHHAPHLARTRLPLGVGLDVEKYPRSPMPTKKSGLRLVWAGAFNHRKDPWGAIDVVQHLRDEHRIDASLTMLGEGELRVPISKAAEARKLRDHVSAPGHGDVADALTHCHGLLHTARWEGLPRVMLEACAIGRPTYAWDAKGVRDIPSVALASARRDPRELADLVARTHTYPPDLPTVESLHYGRAARNVAKFVLEEILGYQSCV